MKRYSQSLIERVRQLRELGKTYGEIKSIVAMDIPKSTLSEWCRRVRLPRSYEAKIALLTKKSLNKARKVALVMNNMKRERLLEELRVANLPLVKRVKDTQIAKIALAMLCLGEASKYNPKSRGFNLGSSDPRIIT